MRYLEHHYGPRIHILEDPFIAGVLAHLGSPEILAPRLYEPLRTVYRTLLAHAVSREFPAVHRDVITRMKEFTDKGVWSGVTTDPDQKVVIANVMRAGNLPSLTCFEEVSSILNEGGARIDHLYFARKADPEGRVIDVDSFGSKVGGTIQDCVLIIPDPMGATGRTVLRTVRAYREAEAGTPRKTVVLHAIVTPESIQRILTESDDIVVYAGRLDRGTSPPDVLETIPGTHPERETGLNENGYIVPGAGGLGEVINNAWC